MVYLKFPPELTEEELMLQANYVKLKKKKKALQDLKKSKQEPERSPQKSTGSTEGRDAREVAKKLIKSGVIAPIKNQKRPEEAFKRSRAFERKLNSTEKAVSSYQPFSEISPVEKPPETKRPKVKKLFESFVPASTDPADKVVEKQVCEPETKPQKGNTIFVHGYKLSEDFLREHFGAFGKIIQIAMENEKKGFITFEKLESAQEAINKMNEMKVLSIELQVSMARRQPVIDPLNDKLSCSMWVSAASSYNRKGGSHRDKRDLQTYDDDIFN